MTTRQNRCRDEGQTMAEYAVVLGVITPFLILTFGLLADGIIERLETVIGHFS